MAILSLLTAAAALSGAAAASKPSLRRQTSTLASVSAGAQQAFPTYHPLNYFCKDAQSDWPMPCVAPSEGYNLRLTKFFLSAWWGPGYQAGGYTSEELAAYAAAHFNVWQLGDRTYTRTSPAASWAYLQEAAAAGAALGQQILWDTYTPMARPWAGITGGHYQASEGGFVNKTLGGGNHKITLPETQWLANASLALDNVVGQLITDDGVDLASDEIAGIQWMRQNTPELIPWANQCGDGTEWLARAGTPFNVPELYSISPPSSGGPTAQAMAETQVYSFDYEKDHGDRFGLGFWPIVNTASNDLISQGISTSLAAFESYAAVAYGATGLMYFTWGWPIWNYTTNAPTYLYPAIQAVNADLSAWGEDSLAYHQVGAVYHTNSSAANGGWAGPPLPSYTATVGDTIVAAMDDDLLLGVKTAPDASAPARLQRVPKRSPLASTHPLLAGAVPDAVAVVVDKRVSFAEPPPPARTVNVTFGALVAAVELVVTELVEGRPTARTILFTRPAADATATAPPLLAVTVTLAGGQGAQFRLYSTAGGGSGNVSALTAAVRALRPWRFNPLIPNPQEVATTQWEFYNFFYQLYPNAPFMMGVADMDSEVSRSEAVFATAAAGSPSARGVLRGRREDLIPTFGATGFNMFAAQSGESVGPTNSSFSKVCNAAMAAGGFAIAAPPPGDTTWTPATLSTALDTYSCHPNFGGAWLSTAPVTAAQAASLAPAANLLRFEASHAYPLAPAVDVAAVTALAANCIPLAPLLLDSSQSFSAAAASLYALQQAAYPTGEHSRAPPVPCSSATFAPLALLRLCGAGTGESPASILFRTYLPLAYGVKGLFYSGIADCAVSNDLLTAVGNATQQVTWLWAHFLVQLTPQSLYYNTPTVLPGAQAPGADQVVVSASDATIVSVFATPGGGTPMLLVVDGSCYADPSSCAAAPAGALRTVTLTLQPDVYAWGVVECDVTKGFNDCEKLILGNTITLSLPVGGAEMIRLTIAQ